MHALNFQYKGGTGLDSRNVFMRREKRSLFLETVVGRCVMNCNNQVAERCKKVLGALENGVQKGKRGLLRVGVSRYSYRWST